MSGMRSIALGPWSRPRVRLTSDKPSGLAAAAAGVDDVAATEDPQGSPVGVGVEEASVVVGEASLLIVGVDDPQGSPVGVGVEEASLLTFNVSPGRSRVGVGVEEASLLAFNVSPGRSRVG